jgi:hypothetical protein
MTTNGAIHAALLIWPENFLNNISTIINQSPAYSVGLIFRKKKENNGNLV